MLGVSERSVRRMRDVTGAYVMDQQMYVLGALTLAATVHPPMLIGTREAWDETSHLCQLLTDPSQSGSERRAK